MANTRRLIAAIVIPVVVAGTFLGFTKPGHQVLFNLGLSAACGSDSSC